MEKELYEAARTDGASRWMQFVNVTLPGTGPTMVFVVLITIISSLLAFDYIYTITNGRLAGSSGVVATLMYKEAFAHIETGYAAALGIGMTFVSALIVMTSSI